MRIVYHLGAHCTDEERLLKCLLKNRQPLALQGIAVPGPARYRNLLRDTVIQLKGRPATRDMQALVLEQILELDEAERLILAWDNFLSYPQWVLKDRLYPAAAERVGAFANIFPEIESEFHFAIRNPASFLPALLAKQKGREYEDFIGPIDIFDIRWSDVIDRIRAANPHVPLTVWCDEDVPLVWPEVLQTVAGHAPMTWLDGIEDPLAALMTPEGMQRMGQYMQNHPPAGPMQRRRVVSAFLDKFLRPEINDMTVDLPGWTQETVEHLTEIYDADVARIAARDDITFIAP